MSKICVHAAQWGFHENWAKFILEYGAEVARFNLRNDDCIEMVESCDGVMWHLSMKPSILQSAEPILTPIELAIGKKTFPNYRTRWHFENKVGQKYLFEALGVDTPMSHCFWNCEQALDWIETKAKFPIVHKHSRGAGSTHVTLVKDKDSAVKITRKAFSDRGNWHHRGYLNPRSRNGLKLLLTYLYNCWIRIVDGCCYMVFGQYPRLPKGYWQPEKDVVLFQEFLPANSYDTRVTIIGNRAFAFRRWNRPKDFRASGGGNIDYDMKSIDLGMINAAYNISRAGKFQSMAYDFLYDAEGNIRVCEMSFGFQNTAVFNCPGHWDESMNWHPGHMWPEEAHVADFLAEL